MVGLRCLHGKYITYRGEHGGGIVNTPSTLLYLVGSRSIRARLGNRVRRASDDGILTTSPNGEINYSSSMYCTYETPAERLRVASRWGNRESRGVVGVSDIE
ncbi:hypothetical protein CY34DRAFT_740769 [Suillus luteus UH-Slu-Lm8-n1]|uniref:Uncharacterized protein n=1 Tax=Suillus luteus UH-Slu-Lm8-n1 TaxID=930992 RepID=A0A0D0AM59_9AGAM|nr:hypothetical protein CY34DRAFT_740769 [Suillus luteus UH-Slu-Lm8-n1]